MTQTTTRPTPGPWYVSPDDAEDCPPHHASGLAKIDTGREGDWPIARLVEWNNAPLLQAAPDLLEACNVALAFMVSGPQNIDPEALETKLREAIIKAEIR